MDIYVEFFLKLLIFLSIVTSCICLYLSIKYFVVNKRNKKLGFIFGGIALICSAVVLTYFWPKAVFKDVNFEFSSYPGMKNATIQISDTTSRFIELSSTEAEELKQIIREMRFRGSLFDDIRSCYASAIVRIFSDSMTSYVQILYAENGTFVETNMFTAKYATNPKQLLDFVEKIKSKPLDT